MAHVRRKFSDALKAQLLDTDTKDAVAITAALRGAGGYGKTTLAMALAHDPDIQGAYFDGILWVELGEQGGGRVLALISDLVALVTGEARTMATIAAARTALGEALGDRRILLERALSFRLDFMHGRQQHPDRVPHFACVNSLRGLEVDRK